jgi:hypothetical protein
VFKDKGRSWYNVEFSQETVCQSEQAYNLEALWVAMGMNLSEAKHAALHRTLKDHSKLSLAKLGSQCIDGGQFIANMAKKGVKQGFR